MEKLNKTKYRIMEVLQENAGKSGCSYITQQEIAEEIGKTKLTVLRTLASLVQDGYVKPDEKHTARYYLTDKALQTLKERA